MIGVKFFNTIFIFINYQIALCSVGITVSTISGYMKVSDQGDGFESRSETRSKTNFSDGCVER